MLKIGALYWISCRSSEVSDIYFFCSACGYCWRFVCAASWYYQPWRVFPLRSIELVVWVAIGGRTTLYGAVLGAFVVNYSKTYLTGAAPEMWLFALGALFVLVTLYLPNGIVGLLKRKRHEGTR